MFKINEDKLTPFDLQVLNMTQLDAGSWRLGHLTMNHPQLGEFRMGKVGMQLISHHGTPFFRQLSWRGQILLSRRHDEMLTQSIDVAAMGKATKGFAAPAGSGQKLGSMLGGGFKSGGLTATAILAQQEAMNHQLDSLKYALQFDPAPAVAPPPFPPSNATIFGRSVQELRDKGFSNADISDMMHALNGGNAPKGDELLAKLSGM